MNKCKIMKVCSSSECFAIWQPFAFASQTKNPTLSDKKQVLLLYYAIPIVAFFALHTRLAGLREPTVYCHSSVTSKALFVALIKRGIY